MFSWCLGVFGTTPRVVVDEGVIEGHILETAYGKDYVGFEGIPYAEPPIGNLRFEVRILLSLSIPTPIILH